MKGVKMKMFNVREELKTAYCLNPNVEYCDKCIICKNTDEIVDELAIQLKKINFKMPYIDDDLLHNQHQKECCEKIEKLFYKK